MYSNSYTMPSNFGPMYRNDSSVTYGTYPYQTGTYPEDERFFWAPFVVGGLAGTALGYGIANNNQINNQGCCQGQGGMIYPVYPVPYSYQYPVNTTSNNFYY